MVDQIIVIIIVWTKVTLKVISIPKDDKHGELHIGAFHVISLPAALLISAFVH